MATRKTAEDIWALVADLAPEERDRLFRLVLNLPHQDDPSAYRVAPPRSGEFSSDDDSLAWDADGWEAFD